MGWEPHPGFGMLDIRRDGESVAWWEFAREEEMLTVQDFEDRAAGDPDHDWRFLVEGPLGGVVYQRHGEATWYAVERLEGFA